MSPMKRELYPANWPEIRAQVKERAGNKCEGCGVANHAVGARDKRGDWHNQEDIDHLNSDVAAAAVTRRRKYEKIQPALF